MSRILVTGATGFFGKQIAKSLQALGHDVHGTTSGPTEGQYVAIDIAEKDAVFDLVNAVKPEIIIHCAAISSVTAGQPIDYFRVNTLGTDYFVHAASKLDHRVRFIFISTAGVYGNQGADLLVEDMCPLPVHYYGMSKLAAERVVRNFSEQVDYTIVRPFNIVGPGQHADFIVPKLVAAFAAGAKQIKLGNIEVYRDYIDIHGATEIVLRLIDRPASFGQTVNLCSGIPTSLKELIAACERVAGYEIEVIQSAEFIRKAEVWKLLGCPVKLAGLIGGLPQVKPIEQVVREMLEVHGSELRNS